MTPAPRSSPISSEIRRVVAKRMPEMAKVANSTLTDMTSWYSPMPAAPMRPTTHA